MRGVALVRMTWSGVAGPRCEMSATSARQMKPMAWPSTWDDITTGAPAASDSRRRRSARSTRTPTAGVGAGGAMRWRSTYSSARRTRSIIVSYDSRAESPHVKMPWFMRTMPTTPGRARASGTMRATAWARRKPGMT